MRSKTDIRRDISADLLMTPDIRAEASAKICAAIAGSSPWRDARNVAIFAPQSREPDVELLWMHGDGKSFAYPRIVEGRLDLFRVASSYELAPGAFGVREPVAGIERAVAPATLDLILVPGVAFTRGGERLGRGGGYYDRLLASLPAHTCKIGVCFEAQILSELPVESHDQRIDFLATEAGLLTVT